MYAKHFLQNGLNRRGYVCSTCGNAFLHKRNMVSHEKIHNRVSAYNCCGIAFQTRDMLRRHRYSIHGDRKEISCSVCGKLFATNTDLTHHYRRETRSVKLSCETCDFTTSRQTDLQVHLATHADKYAYICKTCGKCYKHPSSLSRHVREKHPE